MGVTKDLAFPVTHCSILPRLSPEADARAQDQVWESFVLLTASLREGFAHILHDCHVQLVGWYDLFSIPDW